MQKNSNFQRDMTGFELFHYVDDKASYPLVFWLILSFTGQTDRDRLASALDYAIAQHPLLRSLVVGERTSRRSQIHWQYQPEARVPLDYASDSQPLFGFAGAPDLALPIDKEIGVRIFVRQGSEQVRWYVQFHHAATDGTGAVQFLEDVMRYYASPDGDIKQSVLDERRLSTRGACGLSFWKLLQRAPRFFKRAQLLAASDPLPLIEKESQGLLPPAQALCPAYKKGDVEIQALKRKSRSLGVTINDLLLRAAFQTIDRWQTQKGKSGPIRVVVPVSMRQEADRRMPAANMIGMVFIDRAGEILRKPHELLLNLHKEMKEAKAYGFGYLMNGILQCVSLLPGGLGRMAKPEVSHQCLGTLVLSNLGEMLGGSQLKRDQAGLVTLHGMTLQDIELLPPLRPLTSMAMGVVSYAGRVRLAAHYDHTVMSGEEASGLLQGLIDRALQASE